MDTSSTSAKRTNQWLTGRLSAWRERPLLTAMVVGFIVVWGLRIPAQDGSEWDSILAKAGWAFLVCAVVVAAAVGRRSNKS